MHRILFLILAIAATIPAVAAKYSHRFHNVPVAQALVQVIREHPELNISYTVVPFIPRHGLWVSDFSTRRADCLNR